MTHFTKDQVDQLSAKLDGSHVKKNPKGFDYVEGWRAIAEANRIFGFDGWAREIMNLKSLHDPYQNDKSNWVISYGCTVRITVNAGDRLVIRDGCGFGSGFAKAVGDAHESALKEAETDAMKRALMTFGNPFGLALYDKEKSEVEYGGKQGGSEITDEQYVAEAVVWMKRQIDAATINRTWSAEQERFYTLAKPLQEQLVAARDQALEKFKPKPEAMPANDWKLVADTIKAEIDVAIDTRAVRDTMESKAFLDLEAHSKTAAAFLRDRANKRIATISQSPNQRAA